MSAAQALSSLHSMREETTQEHVYRRCGDGWDDLARSRYVRPDSRLAAALQALELLDQELNGASSREHGLPEHLDIVVVRRPDRSSCTTLRETGSTHCFAESHDSPSVGDLGAATPVVDAASVGAAPDTGDSSAPVSGDHGGCVR